MKKILAILLALTFITAAFAGCGGKTEEPAESTTNAADAALDDFGFEDETAPATEAANGETEPASAADDTTAPAESTSAEGSSDTTAAESTTAAAKVPSTTAEVLAFYNDALNKAYSSKVGYHKERYTDGEKMDAGVALQMFKSLVFKFMGIGAENKYTEDITKGQWNEDAKKHSIRKSTLAAGDVSSATAKPNADGSLYAITINVKGGSSHAGKDGISNSSPIDKCGMCVGTEDKSCFDHKTAGVIYDAIDDTYAGATIDEKYSNAKVTAVIEAATGKLQKLVVEYDINVDIDIGIGAAACSGATHIIYSDFKY